MSIPSKQSRLRLVVLAAIGGMCVLAALIAWAPSGPTDQHETALGAPAEAPVAREASPTPPEEVVDEAPPPPRCESDTDCVAVDVSCGGRSAQHRDRADEVRERYRRMAVISSCGRVPWAPPEEVAAYCREGVCSLDRIIWPDFRRCESEGAGCVVIDDPCSPRLAVRADVARAARRAVDTAERRRQCEGRRATLAEPHRTRPSTCLRGFCR